MVNACVPMIFGYWVGNDFCYQHEGGFNWQALEGHQYSRGSEIVLASHGFDQSAECHGRTKLANQCPVILPD